MKRLAAVLALAITAVACSSGNSSSAHKVGDTVKVKDGTVTVFSYSNGVADVQQCGGHANPLYWRIRQPNGQVASADLGSIAGQLQTGDLGPQDCARGKVRFGYDASAVEYVPPSGGVTEFKV